MILQHLQSSTDAQPGRKTGQPPGSGGGAPGARTAILVTGASGYIGRRLVARLNVPRFDTVYCLARHARTIPRPPEGGRVEAVQADVMNPESYRHVLAQVDTVVHLAALTGKHAAADYFRVNAEGTRSLVSLCRETGVRRFILVSTIAAKYPRQQHYHYAQSKAKAEEIVASSGLDYTIVRPTMVIGSDSPNWTGLARLAQLPCVPRFGSGRALVQPVYIDDLIDMLLAVILEDDCRNQILELGGPEILSMGEFVARIRRGYGRRPGWQMPIPLRPVATVLALLEKPGLKWLPMTAGQLCNFCNDAIVAANPLHERCRPEMLCVDEMICRIVEAERQSSATAGNLLDRECRVFTSYLIGQSPGGEVLARYRDVHRCSAVLNPPGTPAVDTLLLKSARFHPLLTKLADAYAVLLRPTALVRAKLVALSAILECLPATCEQFERPMLGRFRRSAFAAQCLYRALSFLAALMVAVPVFSLAAWTLAGWSKLRGGGTERIGEFLPEPSGPEPARRVPPGRPPVPAWEVSAAMHADTDPDPTVRDVPLQA